ncbi:cell cycle checkpoint protein rad17 [Aspergillus sclerotioniger CBS 115572]|uniref:Cell cycle checkpoint protein rad17 n=1 Tax=Aspergillus sclerotioniger CBS 115572 TaxID=1450535 RepID=A0A317UV06_9EURO|nr:cell cycle checkpoint protein rad17 [Aspergillus sclerotioniger CBS 115572]PWY65281.1 cell cycle checkpoint protein rad17 [Aspergillus sclerotioniger CBS 115572]
MKRKHQEDATTTHKPVYGTSGLKNTEQQLFNRTTDNQQDTEIGDGKYSSDDLIEDDYDSFDEIFIRHIANDRDTWHDDRQDYTPRSWLSKGPPPRLPWAQQFPPTNLDELAVHKRKVSDVKNWLISAFARRDRQLLAPFIATQAFSLLTKAKLLVLRGPAGSAKTTTLSLLSTVLGFDILEWRNPSPSESATKAQVSIAARFDDFLERGNEFQGLDLDGGTGSSGARYTYSNAYTSRRRVILIEEFPALAGPSSSLNSFRLTLLRYLAMITQEKPHLEPDTLQGSPIVIIVSETLLDSRSFPSDNLTAHRLLGPELYNHPRTSIIDFNSIAPTIMYKALNLVLEKEASLSKHERFPSSAILHNISKTGDIRSAIASLEFVCVNHERFKKLAGPPSKAGVSKRATATLTPLERDTMEAITQRETSLGLFHAIGKVVYNKRVDPGSTGGTQVVSPPGHLKHHERPQLSQVCVNELVDEAGIDNQTFISALHENYVPSCNSLSFTDCLDGCIGALSDSDVLSSDTRGRSRFGGQGLGRSNAGADSLRQEDLSYQVATRGILFGLPYPVKRSMSAKACPSHTKSAYKMFFPASLRLLRNMEEIQDLIDLWSNRLLDPFGNDRAEKAAGLGSRGSESTAAVTMISRSDLILHQLPYLAILGGNPGHLKELVKITGLRGNKFQSIAPDNEIFDKSVELPSVASNIRRRNSPLETPSRISRRNSNAFGPRLPPSLEEEGLILLDDDIVDDY